MTNLASSLLPYGVVVLQLGALVLLLGLLFARDAVWVKWVGAKAIPLALIVAAISVAGSLFYSNIIGFDPCILCWWQRIFIYPQVVLFAVAVIKKRLDIFDYSLPLSIIGGLIAIYQILLPYLAAAGIDCGATGVSCTKQYVLAFGYITIPVMSLTVFATLILLAITSRLNHEQK